jgi:hypothetical protein
MEGEAGNPKTPPYRGEPKIAARSRHKRRVSCPPLSHPAPYGGGISVNEREWVSNRSLNHAGAEIFKSNRPGENFEIEVKSGNPGGEND